MARVLIADIDPHRPLDQAVRAVVDRAFKLFPLEVEGRRVLVKPNIIGPFPPEAGATTNPVVLGAVVDYLLERGADVVVGDNPGGMERNSVHTARPTGLVDAARGRFVNLSREVVEVPAGSRFTDSFPLSREVLEADLVVNLPCFKTHLLTTLTGCVKNCFGYVAGAAKAALHLKAPSRSRFSELLADLYRIRPPDLNLVDGVLAMEGNGPTHGTPRPLGKILAGYDGVAVDATMARMMGVDPAGLRLFQIAAERGLGEVDDIEVVGRLEVIPGFQLPATFPASSLEQAAALMAISALRPRVEPERCSRCGECAANCPPRAIRLDPYPLVGDGCISCFCCAELCREGAMVVPEGAIAGEFGKIFR